jgi:hypothetical protein
MKHLKKFTDFIIESQTETIPVKPITKPVTKPRPSPIPSKAPSVKPDPKAKISLPKATDEDVLERFNKLKNSNI